MNTTENKKLLQHAFAEMAQGNTRPFIESLADDVSWTVIGRTKWSKTFVGKPAIFAELLGPLGTRLEGQIRLAAHRFIAEDDMVVVEARGNGNLTKERIPYNNTYCFVCRFVDGKVQELTEYMDTELVVEVLDRQN
ncbi:MAG: nuclear transport factor 2 family protein [Blastocatellia bacterium]|nr:nuclear transport factor 2 family protein [Blastocatellia bacterium]